MSPRHDDDDRPKRSWRDIDRKKDSSHHVDRNDPYAKGKRGPRGKPEGPTSGYKSALDKFFDGGQLPDKFKHLSAKTAKMNKGSGSKRQLALRELREAVGRADVVRATKKILDIDGELPEDAEVLLAVLQHPDEDILRDALELLGKMHHERPLKRSELLKQRVRKVEDLAEEPETAKMAAQLRRELG